MLIAIMHRPIAMRSNPYAPQSRRRNTYLIYDMLTEYANYEAFGRHMHLRNQIRSLSQIAMREPVLIAADSAS